MSYEQQRQDRLNAPYPNHAIVVCYVFACIMSPQDPQTCTNYYLYLICQVSIAGVTDEWRTHIQTVDVFLRDCNMSQNIVEQGSVKGVVMVSTCVFLHDNWARLSLAPADAFRQILRYDRIIQRYPPTTTLWHSQTDLLLCLREIAHTKYI